MMIDEDEAPIEERTLVSVCFINKILAFAAYNEMKNCIVASAINATMADIDDSIRLLKSALQPSVWLIHPQTAANMGILSLLLTGPDGAEGYYRHEILKSSMWNADAAIDVIYNKLSVIEFEKKSPSGRSDNYLWLSSIVDIDTVPLRQALGALILHMQKQSYQLDEGIVRVCSLQRIQLEKFMCVDDSSMRALQIFSNEFHPNVLKGTGRMKEGFSLFSLFDQTKSLPGRQMLHDWMMKPFCDRSRILNRQDGIEFAKRPENTDIISEINKCLKKIQFLPGLLLRIKKAEASFKDWCRLLNTMACSLPIIDYLLLFIDMNRVAEDVRWVQTLLKPLDIDACRSAYATLEQFIDVDQSIASESIVVNLGYDSLFDSYTSTYAKLEDVLISAAHKILQLEPLLNNVSVEYVPQIGYLVAVSTEEAPFLQANVFEQQSTATSGLRFSNQNLASVTPHASNSFEFMFQQDSTCYFKHSVAYELDEEIGDIKTMIIDRQRELLVDVEEQILAAEDALQQLGVLIASLDATISLAQVATQMNFQRPEIVDENVVIIKAGRHPLQELTVECFMPNDVFITPEQSIALITGPNSSGKSVYLKQVGILVYMAHIGSFLPCEKAIVGLTDRIFSRMASMESVSSQLSSFSVDLNQMGRMLHAHTPRSLCLIDEFGKGTSPVDGIALLAATIKHFIELPAKVIYALHFTEIFDPNILDHRSQALVAKYRMETIKKKTAVIEFDDEENECDRTPLFKLGVGVCPSSEGLPCARSAGLPESILVRAFAVKHCITSRVPIPPLKLRDSALDLKKRHLLRSFLICPNWSKVKKPDEDCIGIDVATHLDSTNPLTAMKEALNIHR